ncbi:MAG: RNA-guided endonuclease IscB [Promethearchaeota archaeon]
MNKTFFVYVLNRRGQPLMPTTPRKARLLLQQGKAEVVHRSPFTIQLMYTTGETKQNIELGLDPGYKKTGLSARTEDNREVLAAEITLRADVSKKLTERRMYRRTRRSRKWYRKPRFKNRRRKEGWLAPSIQHKLDGHKRLVEIVKEILPVTRITVEVARFDTQKMVNPEIYGVEYQQGTLQGYRVREYLLEKWRCKCAYCGRTDVPLEVEHVIPKKSRQGEKQGTDRVDNLTIACKRCNKDKSNLQPQEWLKKLEQSQRKHDQQRAQGLRNVLKNVKRSIRAAPFMNVLRKDLAKELNAAITYGYMTKYQRIQEGLEKTHVNDAFIIAGGNAQGQRSQAYQVVQIRRNNRSVQTNRKSFKRSIRRQRYKLRPYDLVKHAKDNRHYRVKGMFNYGTWTRLQDILTGKVLNTSLKNIQLVQYGKGMSFTMHQEVSKRVA